MTDAGGRDDGRGRAGPRPKPGLIDVTVPNAARVGDFLYGGRDNFDADRKAVQALLAEAPSVRDIPASARGFRERSVGFLAGSAGIRQFLDIGAGMVPPGNTHEVARGADPACRVVYVESDPMVLAQARVQLSAAGACEVSCVEGDIGDVAGILNAAAAYLDLDRPVAVMLLSSLAAVASTAEAVKVVASLLAAVPSGSYLAVYHLASDLDPALADAVRWWNATAPRPMTLRTRAEIGAILGGLDLVPPGVVPVDDWRPDSPASGAGPRVPVYGAVARKR